MRETLLRIYRPFVKHICVVIILTLFVQILFAIAQYVNGKLIDSVVQHKQVSTSLIFVGIGFILYATNTLLGFIEERYTLAYLDYSLPRESQKYSLRQILSFSIGQHTRSNSILKTNIITRGQGSIVELLQYGAYQLIPCIVTAVVMSTAMIIVCPPLGVVLLLGILLYAGWVIYDGLKMRPSLKKIEDDRHEYGKRYGEAIRNAPLVITHAQEDRLLLELDKERSEIDVYSEKFWTWVVKRWSIKNLLLGLTQFSVLGGGIILVSKGEYTPGSLVMFWLWSARALERIQYLQGLQRRIMDAYTGVRKYYEMISLSTDVPLPRNPVRPNYFQGKIELKNVSYTYPSRKEDSLVNDNEEKEPAVYDISFIIQPGERVAFVGESGAGKSTIVKLLQRVFDPDDGQILIDGNDLRLLDLEQYRHAVGSVEQPVVLMDDTLRRNILFGLGGTGDFVSKENLLETCRLSRVDRFFKKLEKGFDTVIGERGVWLSGGECQRIGIARALIKNPRILIFDEATSNLDAQNEAAIREAIYEASQGRTTIIIAHRLSTIRRVDKIFVVNDGKIVSVGTHDQLVKSCDLYSKLLSHQLAP